MILAKKVRLKPTPEQERQLIKSVGTARWAYNWALAKQKENHENGGRFISDNDLRKELTKLKQQDEYAWLYEVSNNVSKQAIKDAHVALKNFFTGKRRTKPSFYNDNIKLKVKAKKVLLEKIGWVTINEQVTKDVKYTNPRVSFDGKYWYLAVGIEIELEEVELTDEVLGIDVGIKELAVCSNGMKFKNINKTKAIKKAEKRLRSCNVKFLGNTLKIRREIRSPKLAT
jgi:putative transposase